MTAQDSFLPGTELQQRRARAGVPGVGPEFDAIELCVERILQQKIFRLRINRPAACIGSVPGEADLK